MTIKRNKLGKFWVVVMPSEKSVKRDILFRSDLEEIHDTLNGGLKFDEIELITHDKEEAEEMAEKLLKRVAKKSELKKESLRSIKYQKCINESKRKLSAFESKWMKMNESTSTTKINIQKELFQFRKEVRNGYIDPDMEDFESLALAIISLIVGTHHEKYYGSRNYKDSVKGLADHLQIVWDATDEFRNIESIPVEEFYDFISNDYRSSENYDIVTEDIDSSTPHFTIAMDVNRYSRLLEELKKLEEFVESNISQSDPIYLKYMEMCYDIFDQVEGVSDPASWEEALEQLRPHQLVDFYYEFTQVLEDAGLANEYDADGNVVEY